MAAFARRQHGAELVDCAATHGRSGNDILGYGVFHKTGRRIDMGFARRDILIAGHALDAAPVVDVVVGVEHGDDRLLRAVLVVQVQTGLGGGRGKQRVNDDQAGVTFNDGHVGQIHAADLVHAFGHFKQAVYGVELGLTPQAGVDRGGCGFLIKEVIFTHVPGDRAVGVGDLAIR